MVSKYRNKKTVVDGVSFDSKGEANRYARLQLLERGGVISDLKRQVPIDLQGAHRELRTEKGRVMKYVADFTYIENGELVIEDFKGFKTDVYRLKKSILTAQGVEIREVKA